jgi:hypothetical protein
MDFSLNKFMILGEKGKREKGEKEKSGCSVVFPFPLFAFSPLPPAL